MRVSWLLLLVCGCRTQPLPEPVDGGVDLARPIIDASSPFDLSMPRPPDLSAPPPDLAMPPSLLPFGAPCTLSSQCASQVCLPSGICARPCSSDADCPAAPQWACAPNGIVPVCTCTPGAVPESCGAGQDQNCDGLIDDPTPASVKKFVINSLELPRNRTDLALDLNGDTKLDNALGNIVGALAAQNLDPQAAANLAVASGADLILIAGGSSNGTFANDACGSAVLEMAQTHPAPDFSGAGSFTVDPAFAPGNFQGGISAAGLFSSAPLPPVALVPVKLTLLLPLFGSVSPVTLVGAHVKYQYNAAGTLTSGVLNGAIRNSDVQAQIVPSIAANLTAQLQSGACGAGCAQIEAIFDIGGCVNPDGSLAQANDLRIDDCELASNSIIQNLLAPDVQLFDAAGTYAPNPANTKMDSLSVGFGFTAVSASF